MKMICAALGAMGLIFSGCVSAPVENGEDNDTAVQQQEEESTATASEPICRHVCQRYCFYRHGRRVCERRCFTRCTRH
jgi:hypothetical protein